LDLLDDENDVIISQDVISRTLLRKYKTRQALLMHLDLKMIRLQSSEGLFIQLKFESVVLRVFDVLEFLKLGESESSSVNPSRAKSSEQLDQCHYLMQSYEVPSQRYKIDGRK
jgi:hypothetical protein